MRLETKSCSERAWTLKIVARENGSLQLESVPKLSNNVDSLSVDPLVKVDRIDFIGVADFLCVFNPCLVKFIN